MSASRETQGLSGFPQLVLRLFKQGQDTVQIAKALGVTEAQAVDWLHEARRILKGSGT